MAKKKPKAPDNHLRWKDSPLDPRPRIVPHKKKKRNARGPITQEEKDG